MGELSDTKFENLFHQRDLLPGILIHIQKFKQDVKVIVIAILEHASKYPRAGLSCALKDRIIKLMGPEGGTRIRVSLPLLPSLFQRAEIHFDLNSNISITLQLTSRSIRPTAPGV